MQAKPAQQEPLAQQVRRELREKLELLVLLVKPVLLVLLGKPAQQEQPVKLEPLV